MSAVESLFKKKNYDEAVALVNAIDDPCVLERTIRAESLYSLKRWKEALDDFSHILRHNGPSGNFSIFQKTRTAVAKAQLSKDDTRSFWRSCSDPTSIEMGKIINDIVNNAGVDLEERFRTVLRGIVDDPAQEESWVLAFNTLVAGCKGKLTSDQVPRRSRKKILVSGMGWSGSGAIYDYLSEFEEIYAVHGESRVIEGADGFRGFLRASKDKKTCIENAVDFFFRGILGYAPMKSSSCLPALRIARENTLHPDMSGIYVQGVQQVVIAMCELISIAGSSSDKVEKKLKNLANIIADNLIAYMVPFDKVALLDNCIHIANIDLGKYLEDSQIICCIRDPRSNYVALKKEFAGFGEGIDEYISNQRIRRERIYKLYSGLDKSKLAANRCKIRMINFEMFVLSEVERESLANSLSLGFDKQKRFSNFRPWESMRNVTLHQEYINKEEIKLIENELGEFCYEPCIQPLLEAIDSQGSAD